MIFHEGGGQKTEGPKIEAEGRERGEAASLSHQLEGLGSVVSSPAGYGAEPRPPKGFPLFSALKMASPDTVDYHASLGGGQEPVLPLAYALSRAIIYLFTSRQFSSV